MAGGHCSGRSFVLVFAYFSTSFGLQCPKEDVQQICHNHMVWIPSIPLIPAHSHLGGGRRLQGHHRAPRDCIGHSSPGASLGRLVVGRLNFQSAQRPVA